MHYRKDNVSILERAPRCLREGRWVHKKMAQILHTGFVAKEVHPRLGFRLLSQYARRLHNRVKSQEKNISMVNKTYNRRTWRGVNSVRGQENVWVE